MVLSIARQGIYINKMEAQQNRFIDCQVARLFSIDMFPLRGKGERGTRFSIEMLSQTGNV
jgi:hypothetical protein